MKNRLMSNGLLLICLTAVSSSCVMREIVANTGSKIAHGTGFRDRHTDREVTSLPMQTSVGNASKKPTDSLESDSVLNVIPADVTGFVYARNLLEFNSDVTTLLADMLPEQPRQEPLAKVLAETFDVGFESLKEWENLGLDLDRDFSIFSTGGMPFVPSAVVHVKNAGTISKFLESKTGISGKVVHNGTTYHETTSGGGFVILENLMVYAGTSEMCKKAIDTHQKRIPSIAMNTNYTSLKLDTRSGTNDLAAFFALESIIPSFLPFLKSGVRNSKMLFDGSIWLLSQTNALTLTVQLNGSDLAISSFLRFKSESTVHDYISRKPAKLTHVENLPQHAFLNGSTQTDPEDMAQLIMLVNKIFFSANVETDEENNKHALQKVINYTSEFFGLLGKEMSISMNYNKSLMPDILLIHDTIAADKTEAFMDEQYLAYWRSSYGLYKTMPEPKLGMFLAVTPGPEEAHDGTVIKSYLFPNIPAGFEALTPEIEGLAPKKWTNYYAIKDDKLILSFSADSESIKNTLNRIGSDTPSFHEGPGFDKLVNALSLENNMLLAISPITALKNILGVLVQTNPNLGVMQMLLVNLPENYSIAIAGENRDGGIEGKIFASLGDFKGLINIASVLKLTQ